MDFKKVIITAILVFVSFITLYSQSHNPDSVVQQVFKALTGEAQPLPKDVNELLIGPEWEALAYWDSSMPKQLESMQEAVGDIYQFLEKSFVIKLVNPNDPSTYLNAINGTFIRLENTLTLLSQSGKKLEMKIIFIDKNYLVTEMDGLRMFFTKTRSYKAN